MPYTIIITSYLYIEQNIFIQKIKTVHNNQICLEKYQQRKKLENGGFKSIKNIKAHYKNVTILRTDYVYVMGFFLRNWNRKVSSGWS